MMRSSLMALCAIAMVIMVCTPAVALTSDRSTEATPFPIPPFDCPALPAPPAATNARTLRPGNIRAVMTIGDSITAGFAMQGELPSSFLEYRQSVHSIGAETGARTIFNFIKKYNPQVVGGAEATTLPMTPGAWLDAAVSGAIMQDGPKQVDFLESQIKNHYKSVDIKNDWKFLTILMGANDLCDACKNGLNSTLAQYENYLRATLDKVQKQLPRTFVSVLSIFNISGVYDVVQTDGYCKTLWSVLKTECPCLQDGKASNRALMDAGSVGINNIITRVAAQYNAKQDPGLYVAVQPGLSGIRIPDLGRSFLSSLDCFHPSLAADQAFAYQSWNNLQEPAGQKTVIPDPKNIRYKCPNATSYLM